LGCPESRADRFRAAQFRAAQAFILGMTLVLLPLKYEIDDSVTVTVVLLGEAGRCCTLMGGTWPTGKTETD